MTLRRAHGRQYVHALRAHEFYSLPRECSAFLDVPSDACLPRLDGGLTFWHKFPKYSKNASVEVTTNTESRWMSAVVPKGFRTLLNRYAIILIVPSALVS